MKSKGPELEKLSLAIEQFRTIGPELPAHVMQLFLIIASLPEGETMTMQDLEKKVGGSQAAVSRNFASLTGWTHYRTSGPGLIERVEDPMNRRQKLVSLTTKGRRFADMLRSTLT